ncbi:MAG: GNAT family N-acetyltransferase [Bacteroidaceae bacterium]|nr:GNAT family N-acetyltransferase [Bacteroidaceae bacterium]
MMMTEKQITAATADEQTQKLYETAFPEDEQIPWDELLRLVKEMSLDFTTYYDEEKFIGFTIVYPRKAFNWYWYFAVREDLRGKGYGQQILTQLIEKYKGQSCVLDMESPYQTPCPNPEQRKRRHGFYLRNGFRDTNVYRTYNDITMTVMMMGPGTFTLQDWDDITNELKQFWWPEDIKESM